MNLRILGALVRRESRGARGRMVFMTACLALGVAAVTGVAALVDAIETAVRRDARALLAADVTVQARRPFTPELDAFLDARDDVGRVDVVELSAMVSGGGGDARLVELKAPGRGYPHYGALVTEPAGLEPGALSDDELIAAPELLLAFGAEVGDVLRLGGEEYRVAGALVDEPDRLEFAMTLGPRVFLSNAGLARTGLATTGSRVKYRALLRFDDGRSDAALGAFVRELRASVPAAAYLETRTAADPNPGLRRGLARMGDYLGLVALLSLLIGGAGVAQVVRAWLAGRARAIAILRSLGMRPREVFVAYLGHVLALALVGCTLGIAAGLAAPRLVSFFAPDLVPPDAIPPPSLGAALRGLALGFGTAIVFSIPPLTAVWRVSPARVLRASAAPLPTPRGVRVFAGLALGLGVLVSAWIQSGRPLVALAFTAGLVALVALLTFGARLAVRFAGRLPRTRFGPTLRHGVAALARPGAGTVGASIALGLGTLVVVAMVLVERRMRTEFERGVSPDAPSVFLVDVQPDQWAGVQSMLANNRAESVDSTPVIMARLAAVGGVRVSDLLERDDARGRRRWLLTREQRLTWTETLPPGNEVVAGSLWSDPTRAEVSIERGFAEDLGVALGDTLTCDVQGVPIELTVTSLREVDWASFQINFFLLVEVGALQGAPGWRLVSARVAEASEGALQNDVARAYPNVSVLRMRPLLAKLAAVFERVALAVRLLGVFTVITGVVILAGAVAAAGLERNREAALLKTLGVTRRGVARFFAVEYGLIGLIAGLGGGLGAWVLSWAFLASVAQLDGVPPLGAIPAAAVGGAALAIAAGLAASLRALAVEPARTLRS